MENMENQTQIQTQLKSPLGKIILTAVVFSLLVSAVAGAAVYFWKDKEGKSQSAALSQKVQLCEDKQREALPSLTEQKEAPSQNILPPADCPPGLTMPVVHFVPGGLFTDAEKQDLTQKIITPFFDYQKDSRQEEPIIIIVNKHSDPEKAQKGYYYDINSYGAGVIRNWLERKTGEAISVWIPDCLGICQFSDSYRQKHPDVVAKYNAG